MSSSKKLDARVAKFVSDRREAERREAERITPKPTILPVVPGQQPLGGAPQ